MTAQLDRGAAILIKIIKLRKLFGGAARNIV